VTPSSHTERTGIPLGAILLACAAFLAPTTERALAGDPGTAGEEKHWALRPIARPDVPKDAHPVDWFVDRALDEADLERNAPADRHTLLRRATFDLTGLPPTREEIDDFVSDSSDEAWEQLIDRLLDSPHYGERWGRHWLDVARYVQGSIKVPGIDRIDMAAPYRDYVVRSFNRDKPYDVFIREQLAGDLVASRKEDDRETWRDRTIAPAFLSIGPWFEECTDPNKLRLDIVDEQLATLSKAFLGMDFACARCHDHKHDPIPTRDYYAMAGIFRSTRITEYFSENWKDGRPRLTRKLAPPERLAAYEKAVAEREALREERFAFLENARKGVEKRQGREAVERARAGADDLLLTDREAERFDGQKELKTVSTEDGEAIATRRELFRWVKYYLDIPEGGDHLLALRYAAADDAAVQVEVNGKTRDALVSCGDTGGVGPSHYRWTTGGPYALPEGRVLVRLKAGPNEPFPRIDRLRVVKSGHEADTPALTHLRRFPDAWPPTVAETEALLDEAQRERLAAIDERLAAAREAVPRLEDTLAVTDAEEMVNEPVHVGGGVYQTKGEPVPRGVPTLAKEVIGEKFPVPEDESGRLQLANWLTHPDHPLTARVMANRIWHWHFGTGLVRTPGEFGAQGSPPSHPELLDWLAAEFIESGWSIEHLHRVIMTSDTYRASSRETEANLARDADGRLLSRFPDRRLEIEAIYDAMLASTGRIPRQSTDRPLDFEKSEDRGLYILTSGGSPMGLGMEIRKMFPLFGFDPTGRPMHDRDGSVTPKQSLWWLNNPLPRHYAEGLAERLLKNHDAPADRARAAHEIALGRPPDSRAERAILRYVGDSIDAGGLEPEEAWTRACLGLFSSRNFTHVE